MNNTIVVSTGCRLHFGLCPLGRSRQELTGLPSVSQTGPTFAGLGAGLESPGFEIEFTNAEKLQIDCGNAARARRVIGVWFAHSKIVGQRKVKELDSLPIRIKSSRGIPAHKGFGSGTQFDLAILAGLQTFFGLKQLAPKEAASVLRRGTRSLVGTVAFHRGGLIWDPGQTGRVTTIHQDSVSRTKIPEDWRVLTIVPPGTIGLSGQKEIASFSSIPEVNQSWTNELVRLATAEILPAAENQNFEQFTNGVYEYGYLAGKCFETIQGGPYNGIIISEAVTILKKAGARGFGQSSWGPCIFSWFENDETVNRFLSDHRQLSDHGWDFRVCQPGNQGASIERVVGRKRIGNF